MNKTTEKPVELPETAKDATPMERLEAFARRIVRVPKTEIDAQDERGKDERKRA